MVTIHLAPREPVTDRRPVLGSKPPITRVLCRRGPQDPGARRRLAPPAALVATPAGLGTPPAAAGVVAAGRVPYSKLQPQELTSRTMTPRPVSMWVVQGMQGLRLRTARRTSMPLIWSSGTDSSSGVSTTHSS
jgi:hypothetical protein